MSGRTDRTLRRSRTRTATVTPAAPARPAAVAATRTRLARPAQLRAYEARRAVAGIDDPREAWEALATAGLVPFDWIDDPRRGYARDRVEPSPLWRSMEQLATRDARTRRAVTWGVASGLLAGGLAFLFGSPPVQRAVAAGASRLTDALEPIREKPIVLPYPPTIGLAIGLAGDVPNVLAAEHLARLVAGRPGATRVIWLHMPTDELVRQVDNPVAVGKAPSLGPRAYLAVQARTAALLTSGEWRDVAPDAATRDAAALLATGYALAAGPEIDANPDDLWLVCPQG